jgi:Family of unknown function (DUF6318)
MKRTTWSRWRPGDRTAPCCVPPQRWAPRHRVDLRFGRAPARRRRLEPERLGEWSHRGCVSSVGSAWRRYLWILEWRSRGFWLAFPCGADEGRPGEGRMEQGTIRMPSGRVRSSTAVAVAGLLMVTGVLSGCDSAAKTPGASSPSPSVASPTPSPSPSAPSPSASPTSPIPAAARVKSDKGAEAFVRYFFDKVNQAWTTPQTGLVPALSDSGCQFCLKTESDAKALVTAGQKYRTEPISLKTVAALTGAAPKGQTIVRTDATQNQSDVLSADNAVVRSDSKKDLQLITGLIWKGGRWLVYEVEAR